MTRADLVNLHPDDIPLWLSVETAVWRLALAANLPLRSVVPTPKKFISKVQGLCYFKPKNRITISLRQMHRKNKKTESWGDRFALHQLLDTIAHEVAHLKSGSKPEHHGEKFFRAFAEMLVLAEDINIRFDIQCSGCNLKP